MAKGENMKFKTLLDNSGLQKGSQEAKQALKDLSKTGQESLSSLGDIFGVNTGKIQQMTSAIAGLGLKLEQTGEGGKAAFGKILQSISGVGGAIAGLGIAGAIAGFKQLTAEAERFRQTVAGARLSVGTEAYADTYRQVVADRTGTGGWWSRVTDTWKKATTQLRGIGVGQEIRDEAQYAAFRAEEYAQKIFDLQRKSSERAREWSEWEAQIAEYQRIIADRTESSAARANAAAAAEGLINRLYDERIPIEREISRLMDETNALAESTPAQLDAANQQNQKVSNLEGERVQQLKSLDRLQRSIGSSMAVQSDEAKKLADEAARMRKEMESAAISAGSVISGPGAIVGAASGLQGIVERMTGAGRFFEGNNLTSYASAEVLGVTAHIGFEYDKSQLVDISNEVSGLVQDMAAGLGESIGGLICDLATGGDAWGNFASSAVSAFGDMAVSVGKMAISTGVATLGIKAALESLNGYAAIAAGVALVALGTAVKSGLGNIAAGNYSASSNVASSGYSSSSAGAFERQMEVRVTGTLSANGSQLIAVLNNENNRISTTS